MTVCFDLDGTLLYTLEDLHNALNHSLKKYGYKEVSLDETRLNVGNGIRNLILDSAKSSDKSPFNICNIDNDAFQLIIPLPSIAPSTILPSL